MCQGCFNQLFLRDEFHSGGMAGLLGKAAGMPTRRAFMAYSVAAASALSAVGAAPAFAADEGADLILRGGTIRPLPGAPVSSALAIKGGQVPLAVPTSVRCTTCSGTGARPGTSPVVCPQCGGRGIESQGQGMFSISQPCSRCGGRGTIIEDPCPTCGGTGAVRSVKRYRVNIPAGVHDGSRIRLAGKGEPGQNGAPPGDRFVITRVSPSPVFKQMGENLEVEVPISVVEALRGGEIEVPTLSGRKRLRIAPGTKSGTVQRLRGEGPPKLSGEGKGDIHYRFVIELPKELDDDQTKAVDALAKTMNGNPRKRLFDAVKP